MISQVKSLSLFGTAENTFFFDPTYKVVKYGHWKSWSHIKNAAIHRKEIERILESFIRLDAYLGVLSLLFHAKADNLNEHIDIFAAGLRDKLQDDHYYVMEVLLAAGRIDAPKTYVEKVLYDSTDRKWIWNTSQPWEKLWYLGHDF